MDDIFLARERAAGAIDFGTLEEAKRQVDGDDWIEVWKKHFRPIHLSAVLYFGAEMESVIFKEIIRNR